MNQYPKAIKVILVGVICFVAKKYLGLDELLTEDYVIYLDLVIGGLVAYFFGRYTRLTKEEAEQIQ